MSPTVRGKALDAATISKLVRDAGIAAVPHGFRSRSETGGRTDRPPQEVVEAALAHVIDNPDRGGLRALGRPSTTGTEGLPAAPVTLAVTG